MPIETQISKSTSRTSTLNRNIEIFSLTPATLLTLWEIDASVALQEVGLASYDTDSTFRFHNSVKLLNTSLIWRGKEYRALPIQADGFEYSGKGSIPTPKLTLAINESDDVDGERKRYLEIFKSTIHKLNDLSGVKVTRRRVFAKYIDAVNFVQLDRDDLTKQEQVASTFTPDPNMQFDPDIYYIDRKSLENKSMIEFELASIIDVEGTILPGRIVSAKRCPWQYRGFGCLYEYEENRVPFIHGIDGESTMPKEAPPVANEKDELIQGNDGVLGPGVKIQGNIMFQKGKTYNKGWSVYVEKDGIKYYFVSKQDGVTASPPNPLFWIEDKCSHTINGCRLRWGGAPSLPGGFFPAVLTTI